MHDAMIDRIRALMAKAESTDYPAEAATFMAKAQTLIDEYAIDEARLHGVDPATVGHESIEMRGSYSRERALIWAAVADANRCRVLTLSKPGSSAVMSLSLVGRKPDREIVAVLATSLELQATRRAKRLELSPWESAVVQRRSFLRGFAGEVAQRLARAKAAAAPARSSAVASALELAAGAADRYIDDHFDVTTRRSQARTAGLAYSKGRLAGATADVGASRLGGQRRSLGSG